MISVSPLFPWPLPQSFSTVMMQRPDSSASWPFLGERICSSCPMSCIALSVPMIMEYARAVGPLDWGSSLLCSSCSAQELPSL